MKSRKKKAFTLPALATNHLRQLGVLTVYLFGSRATGVAGPLSDYDFAVLLKGRDVAVDRAQQHELYKKLYRIFSEIVKPETLEADTIDIIFLQSPMVPFELKHAIIRSGRLLMDDNPRFRSSFEEAIILGYADFSPVRAEMSKALLKRI